MRRIQVSRTVGAPSERVWAVMSDLASHQTWMKDAHSLVFLTEQRTGVGTRMAVETRVGPLRTRDVMEVVGWEEGRSIDVVHQGNVVGWGRFELTPNDGATTVTWGERLKFPWWLGGAVGAWLARPALTRLWRGNLKRLEGMVRGS